MAAKVSRHVYVIASTVGITKIGITSSLTSRLSGMQSDSPVHLRLFGALKLPYRIAKEIEALCHKEFSEFRSHGEWFKVDPKVAWECVQKHHNAVITAADEMRQREDWLINELEAQNSFVKNQ